MERQRRALERRREAEPRAGERLALSHVNVLRREVVMQEA